MCVRAKAGKTSHGQGPRCAGVADTYEYRPENIFIASSCKKMVDEDKEVGCSVCEEDF